MPYLRQSDRFELDMTRPPDSPGELNYVITRVVTEYLARGGAEKPVYADFNEAMGVLECAKHELYRRMLAPYEDRKKEENGDVYRE
jgi:hypothetical protein